MKNYKVKLLIILGLVFPFSCEDYLDVAPDAVIDEEVVFSTFNNAQGFVEEMYALVVSYEQQTHTFQDFLLGDDGFVDRPTKASGDIDAGRFNDVIRDNFCYLNNHYNADYGSTGTNSANVANTNAFNRQRPGLYDGSLRGIRKANIVIENVENRDLMVNATQAEKDVILGQAYFFRAFFHNEIMKFWGRYPYIDRVIIDDFRIPRPETYKEVALRANEDYIKAIQLLPVNWDLEPYGQLTQGENRGRLTKGTAYAFQGKNLLLAASPLMKGNNVSINTYDYDTELCDMAVEAFSGILQLADQGRYALASWENYDDVFWRSPAPGTWPGSTEFIFSATGGSRGQATRFMASGVNRAIHTTSAGYEVISPTHNFIHNNFGMANGLSIEDDLSGNFGPPTYDPTQPFENRDPRFYRWHIIDGQIIDPGAGDPNHVAAQLWFENSSQKGFHRSTGAENIKIVNNTGYMWTKFYPKVDGKYHTRWNPIIDQYVGVRMHMRLTDVYLMYAEALHASRGATAVPSSYGLSAEGAINLLRNRAGIPNVHPNIVGDNNKFMDELRRERSVELSYEAHRWVDIRRWGVAHLDKYRRKLALDFPQDRSNFTETLLVDRICEFPQHYWLPFPAEQTQIYEGFPQNPGW
ncbi:RagB/SusD family nutrient uptake outer membrane protein [Winogradskyella flava]|uniref:RagB/SusD family nutrient uptake outer membrane protein n=1 Tax=Winogradskyella flava TaxID=1884876 RepID=A0A842ISA6_9FLAO|nr:RagB/SusD family nutrient uptake outer membrane protein [Winogradskyella flava]MBC2844653.1 RagB/SusD family nutrient uptake outer membrane protein [Winogradskyella flava]